MGWGIESDRIEHFGNVRMSFLKHPGGLFQTDVPDEIPGCIPGNGLYLPEQLRPAEPEIPSEPVNPVIVFTQVLQNAFNHPGWKFQSH